MPSNDKNRTDNRNQIGRVRLIGGVLKNSIIRFSGDGTLRPTPSAVRETLFNWLGTRVVDARCLDLFAGTGALGFEAVSRGAQHCIMVERNHAAADAIRGNSDLLKTATVSVEQTDALSFLSSAADQSFDIIFLDPPFAADLVAPCLQSILEKGLLRTDAVIYLETASDDEIALPAELIIGKEKRRGGVAYRLLSRI